MWFLRLLYLLAFRLQVYLLWSGVYRTLYHDRYLGITLQKDLIPSKVAEHQTRLHWIADGARELWDAVGSPHWVQKCVNATTLSRQQPSGSLDCDEFASWAAAVLKAEYSPCVLNVCWRDKWFVKGHHVCLYILNEKYFHTGNWGNVGPYDSLHELVLGILAQVKKTPADLVGWSTFSPNLVLDTTSTKMPPLESSWPFSY
jgi:hypothetical protein